MSTPHPAAAGLDLLSAIASNNAALATAAETNLTADVEHCPGWTVADLVAHVYEVHWFWRSIAAGRLSEPPAEDTRPPRPSDDRLIADFRAGADQLVHALAAADQAAPVWTWAPSQRDIAFITRHQVQEAAVHRWDAENAAGKAADLDAALAVDAIEEFLTFSVSSESDHPDKPRPSLAGSLVLAATDVPANWTVHDAALPGTLAFERGAAGPEPAVLSGTASGLLLWLYGRVDLPATGDEAPALLARFRNLCFTD